MTRPPKPPIVHRLEQRCAGQPLSNSQRFARQDHDDVGAMFWASVAVLVVLAGAILVVGTR